MGKLGFLGELMSNPYHKLGSDNDPFAVSNKFSLPMCLGEAFKKLMCAGINGRLKSVSQDYKEATYSIQRAIDDLSKYSLQKTSSVHKVHDVIGVYRDAFPNINEQAVEAAKSILFFAVYGQVHYLEAALVLANEAHKIEFKKEGDSFSK